MLKLQYFGHLMGRDDSLEKTLTLGKIEGRRTIWMDGITDSVDMSLNKFWEMVMTRKPGVLQSMRSHRVRLNRRMSASTSTSITEMFSSLLRVPGETEISRLLCFSFK